MAIFYTIFVVADVKTPTAEAATLVQKRVAEEGKQMTREFLQNFKVGDQPLSKEIIDSIMDENGRDIEAAKKPYADYDHIKEQLKTAQDGLKAFEGVDVAKLQGEITTLQGKLNDSDKNWQAKLDAMAFDGLVKEAITSAKGKNAKAIAALLDIETLKTSKNQEADIKTALENLKKDNGYLFDDDKTPPPYSGGTGGNKGQPSGEPTSLAGALRAKYNIN